MSNTGKHRRPSNIGGWLVAASITYLGVQLMVTDHFIFGVIALMAAGVKARFAWDARAKS